MKTFILLITVMVQSDPDPITGRRDVAITIHSRDFMSERECEKNKVTVAADYKAQGFRRPSIVCLPRTGLEGDHLNEQDYSDRPAPQAFTPTQKLPPRDEPKVLK